MSHTSSVGPAASQSAKWTSLAWLPGDVAPSEGRRSDGGGDREIQGDGEERSRGADIGRSAGDEGLEQKSREETVRGTPGILEEVLERPRPGDTDRQGHGDGANE